MMRVCLMGLFFPRRALEMLRALSCKLLVGSERHAPPIQKHAPEIETRKGRKERPHRSSRKSSGMGRRCKTRKDGRSKDVFRKLGATTRPAVSCLERGDE